MFAFANPSKAPVLDHLGVAGRSDQGLGFAVSRAVFVTQPGTWVKAMSDAAPSVTPERIMQLVWAFAPPLVIEAAVRHRVFDVLAEQQLTLDELAQATGASSRGLAAIVDVLVGVGLLARDDAGRYALTPESDAFLVSHQPGFIGGIFRHVSAQLLPNWLHLADIVGSGKPARPVNIAAEGAPFFAEFVEDIFPLSYPSARALAGALDLGGRAGRSPCSIWGRARACGASRSRRPRRTSRCARSTGRRCCP